MIIPHLHSALSASENSANLATPITSNISSATQGNNWPQQKNRHVPKPSGWQAVHSTCSCGFHYFPCPTLEMLSTMQGLHQLTPRNCANYTSIIPANIWGSGMSNTLPGIATATHWSGIPQGGSATWAARHSLPQQQERRYTQFFL